MKRLQHVCLGPKTDRLHLGMIRITIRIQVIIVSLEILINICAVQFVSTTIN